MTTAPTSKPTRPRRDKQAEAAEGVDIGTLDDSVGYHLRRAQLAVFDDFIRTLSPVDLRPAQFSVLTVIEHNPGLSQVQVCDALGIQRTNFVPLLDELEERGLARRERGQDRRSYALYLTDAGHDLMKRARRAYAGHERRINEMIGADGYDQIIRLLVKLADLHR